MERRLVQISITKLGLEKPGLSNTDPAMYDAVGR